MTSMNNPPRIYTLDNGLVVALQNTPTETVAVKLRVNYGSSHEHKGEEGMAHFLEHCLVTGGSMHYTPERADSVRVSFGDSGAHTNLERTCLIGDMLATDLESWLDYASDHFFRPRFDAGRVDGERKRVLSELSDEKSDPFYQSKKEFNAVFYRGHPKGIFTLGKEEVIKNAGPDVLSCFHGRGFHPNNMDLFLVGALPDNVEKLVEQYFGSLSSGENTRKEFPHFQPLRDQIVIRRPAPERINPDNPQESSAQIFLHYLGPREADEDTYAARTMNQILGGDTISLLFQNIGLKMGVYRVNTHINGDYNAGELGVYAAVPARAIDTVVQALFEELHTMKTKRVNDSAIERIKKSATYSIAKAYETNQGRINAIERHLDDHLTPTAFIEGYNRVTPKRVMEVANKYLPDRETGEYVLYIRDPLQE